MKSILKFCWTNLELLIWTFALLYLFLISPEASHFSLCPIKNLGFNFCPGCGLGHAVHYALVMDFKSSIAHHPLGIIAIFVIIRRIIQLIINNIIKPYKNDQKSITAHSGR